jgi:signal transduction histidine kinase
MVKHIVLNLLSNAIKFSSENSVIELHTEQRERSVSISVRDHGIGIPQEDQEHLFKRFFRSSNVTNIQGTGLGLHIVRKYAELMDGIIECASEIGKGTKFIITFNNTKATHENDPGN